MLRPFKMGPMNALAPLISGMPVSFPSQTLTLNFWLLYLPITHKKQTTRDKLMGKSPAQSGKSNPADDTTNSIAFIGFRHSDSNADEASVVARGTLQYSSNQDPRILLSLLHTEYPQKCDCKCVSHVFLIL